MDSNRSRRATNDRASVALEVIFHAHGEPPRIGTIEDLSAGGARLVATKACRAGEVVLVYLPWPSRDEPMTVTSVVRWVEGRRMGIQFSLADARQNEALSALRAGSGGPSKSIPVPATSKGDDPFSRDQLLAAIAPGPGVERRVRFQEVDAAGTIYYSRVFEFFGDAYIDFLERGGVSVPRAMQQPTWFAPLVHAEAEYLGPMRFGDAVVVQIVRVRCGRSAATVGYRISSPDGRPLVVGHTVHVFVDAKTFRPCPIPTDVQGALTKE